MGIRSLLKYIKENELYKFKDIPQKSYSGHNGFQSQIEILVDAHALNRAILKMTMNEMKKYYGNKFFSMAIGEFDILSKVYGDFHVAFQKNSIKLVWIVDGPKLPDSDRYKEDDFTQDSKSDVLTWRKPKGTNISSSHQKQNLESVSQRNHRMKPNDNKTDQKLSWRKTSNCGYSQRQIFINIEKDQDSRKEVARLFKSSEEKEEALGSYIKTAEFEICLSQLKSVNAEIIYLLQGYSSDYVAQIYKERKSDAIISNNTDFVLYKDCNVIFSDILFEKLSKVLEISFDNENIRENMFVLNKDITFPITNLDMVCECLNLKSDSHLIMLKILRSRDETSERFEGIMNALGLKANFNIKETTDFIIDNNLSEETWETLPQFQSYLANNPEFLVFAKNVIKRHNDFLKGVRDFPEMIYQPQNYEDSLTKYLAEGVSTGRINRGCYRIHNGVLIKSICFEKVPSKVGSIMDVVDDIRRRIYPYLLKKSLTKVVEWTPRKEGFFDVAVTHSDVQANAIKGEPDGVRIFEDIFTYKESGTLKCEEIFETEKTLLLCIIRYFYKMTNKGNLNLTNDEFEALFVTIFYQYAKWKGVGLEINVVRNSFRDFRRMEICPSNRCITIATWFMNLHYLAKYICGGALNIVEFIPPPVALMNGSTFVAFYETLAGDERRADHLSDDDKSMLLSAKSEMMEKFRGEYKVITDY